jgi:hypothetical protein
MPTTEPRTDNGRTIAAMYEAFGRGEVADVLERMSPELEWIETEAENIPTVAGSRLRKRCWRVCVREGAGAF